MRPEPGPQLTLAERDRRDSSRATSPLMVALGAITINNSGKTLEETADAIIAEVEKKKAAR